MFFYFQPAEAKKYDLEAGIKKIAAEISQNQHIPKNSTMAIVGFEESTKKQRLYLSGVIEDELTVHLVDKKPGKIIAKNHIDTVLQELKLTRDDVFDGQNRKQFGKLASADLIVSGTYWLNKNDITISITVVNIENGLAYYSKKIQIKRKGIPADLLKREFKRY